MFIKNRIFDVDWSSSIEVSPLTFLLHYYTKSIIALKTIAVLTNKLLYKILILFLDINRLSNGICPHADIILCSQFYLFLGGLDKTLHFVGSINLVYVSVGQARVEMLHGPDGAPDKPEGVKGAICIICPNTSHLDVFTVIKL